MTTKLCVRCKWMNSPEFECRHPNNLQTKRDPVVGTVTSAVTSPWVLRALEAKCGPQGQWYVANRFWRVLDLLCGEERK